MKRKFFIMVMAFGLLFVFQGKPCRAGAPTERVKNMLNQVMAIQTDPQLEGPNFRNQRRIAIKKIIAENFAIDAMAKEALGNFWNKLGKAQHTEFKSIFKDLFQDSYTRMVLDFLKQEKILYTREDDSPQGLTMVKTIIQRPNEEIVVDYFLAPASKELLVHDVQIDGVSIVGNYQTSFARVIRQESYNTLLEKMRLQQKAIEKSS